MSQSFHYENTETKRHVGGKTVRKVKICNGKGTKSVTKYHKGKKVCIVKPISKKHIHNIKNCKFVPGLFSDCREKLSRRKISK
jgi:hypothetical protein